MTGPVLDIQKPDIGVVIELYEVDCTAIFNEILRFAPAPLIADRTAPVPQAITWRGNLYEPRACQSSGWAWDGTGPLPQPKLTIGNTDRAISAICIPNNDLQGAIVTRHRVPFKYLDGQPDADPDIEFDPDLFVIDQKTTMNKMVVEFSLGAAIDIQGRLIPGRQIMQSYCSFRYRVWNGSSFVYSQGSAACPYTGTNYFDAKGNAVVDPALDKPSKRLASCCKLRFPTGDLPFGGFPGAAKVRGA
jgi:lambda family phage minor tail protein L